MCRNSVSLIDTPQGPEDHHTELYLSLCNILYGKELKETTDMLYTANKHKPENCPSTATHEIKEKELLVYTLPPV